MGRIRKVDQPCIKCGVMMHNVPRERAYCDECRKEATPGPKKLTLTEIMREADKEGLQYASYCKKHGLY